jgi:hypothetical protein
MATTLQDATSSIALTEAVEAILAATLANATSQISATETISAAMASSLAPATASFSDGSGVGEIVSDYRNFKKIGNKYIVIKNRKDIDEEIGYDEASFLKAFV